VSALPELIESEAWLKKIVEAAAEAVAKVVARLPEGMKISEAQIAAVVGDVLNALSTAELVAAVKADVARAFLTGKLPVRKGRGSGLAG